MNLPIATAVACLLACLACAPLHAGSLTLDDTFARVAETHPELRMTAARRRVLEAELDDASLRPPLVLGAEVENVLGSGEARGLDAAEVTLSLASVFERGGKLDARRTLAQSRIDALAIERESRRLDLLADTARRYLAVVAARARMALAKDTVVRRIEAVEAARRRHKAGAVPVSVVLAAEASLAEARLGLAAAEQATQAAKRYLAALWGEREPRFRVARANLARLPDLPPLQALAARLNDTPELRAFNDQRRMAEARVALADSQREADIDWQLGVRRLAGGDVGLVAGLSLPLGAGERAAPGIRAAQARLTALAIEREAAGMALYATLAEAHGRYRLARQQAHTLADDILPRLAQASRAAESAWRAGAAPWLEWSELQQRLAEARSRRLQALVAAHTALIEMQRLLGRSLRQPDEITDPGETP